MSASLWAGCLGVAVPPAVAQQADPASVLEFDVAAPAVRSEQGRQRSPDEALQEALPRIVSWPKERGEVAIRALVARGESMIPAFRDRLRAGSLLEKAAAARALCLLGDRDSLRAVEMLLQDRRHASRCSPLLNSIAELDPDRAIALALQFLDHSSPSLRTAAAALLREEPNEAVRRDTRLRFTSSERGETRLQAFQLLVDWDDESLPESALAQVGHDHAPFAEAIAEYLSVRLDGALATALTEKVGEEPTRESLHALLVLAMAERRSRQVWLPADWFERYLGEMQSSDPLLRAVASIACATIGYRTESLAEATRSSVLPALVDVVTRVRMFADFRLCHRAAVAMLERLTGQSLGESVPAWRDYWAREGGAEFEPVRELSGLREGDEPSVALEWQRMSAELEWVPVWKVWGENYYNRWLREQWQDGVVMPSESLASLLLSLREQGLFSAERPRELVQPSQGAERLTISVRGSERSIVASPEHDLSPMTTLLWESVQPFLWQVLLPRDERLEKVYAEEEAWWTRHRGAGERHSRLVSLGLLALENADSSRGQEVLELLDRLPEEDPWLSPKQARSLATAVSNMGWRDARRDLALSILKRAPSDCYEAVLEGFRGDSVLGMDGLVELLRRFDRVDTALRDARPWVRQAAVRAIAEDPKETWHRLEAAATSDPDLAVQSEALALLSRSPSPRHGELLLDLATGDQRAARVEVLKVLGRVHDDRVLGVLAEALREDDSATAQAAIQGLGLQGGPGAAATLGSVVAEVGPGEPRGYLALSQLKSMPGSVASPVLRKLAESGSSELAREARFALADVGEMETVPFLLDQLETDRHHRRAMLKLTLLFCQDWETEPWRFRSLYEASPGKTADQHFFAAMRSGGARLDDPVDPADPELRRIVAEAVADERWFVRRRALEFLERETGHNLGTLTRNAKPEEARALARQWVAAVAAGEDLSDR